MKISASNHIQRSAVFSAVLLSMASASFAQPTPVENEPEIVKEGTDWLGRVSYIQRFSLPDLTINRLYLYNSQVYHVFGGAGGVTEPISLRVRCRVPPNGLVQLPHCEPVASPGSAAAQAFNAVTISYENWPEIPRLRLLKRWSGTDAEEKKWALYRQVEFDLNVPAITVPDVDLAAGKIVEVSALRERARTFREVIENYPIRALREDRQANLEAHCQIQGDLSIICDEVNSDPPEDLRYFEPTFREAMLKTKANATLADGSDARGVRFRVVFPYRLRQR
ncbi:MAG: hypothetical protein ABJ205_07605 [Erythrobacter sp.]|uniref:hypothetical protein n=1 Tax=Erythrobacter sp. TaxID=1042 RepID=UPI0032658E2B